MTQPKELIADAITKLDQLGSASAIRTFLQDTGIKGFKRNAHSCVLARYFQSISGLSVVVSSLGVIGGHSSTPIDLPLPLTVEMFVQDFDAGYYPELEVYS